MNWRKLIYWLPVPLILIGIVYLVVFKRADMVVILLLIVAGVLAAISVRVGKS